MAKLDVDALVERMLGAIRASVQAVRVELLQKVAEVSERLSSIPRGEKGDVGAPGEPGAPGMDAVLPDVQALVQEEFFRQCTDARLGQLIEVQLTAAIEALPRPKDGAPGADAVLPDIAAMVAEAAAALPPAKDGAAGRDGKDAVLPDIAAMVSEAAARLPRAKDGRDADMTAVGELVVRLVDERVAAAMSAIELPRDGVAGPAGRDAVLPDIQAMVDEALAAALRTIPPPQDGRNGVDGTHGRDAAELHIIPSIDEAKSYRRGTWASHRGGLIRALRETEAVVEGDLTAAGWEVMVEGIAALSVAQGDDPRCLVITSALTSGVRVRNELRVPVMTYREVWREGDYAQGDVVTWGGSAWHCQRTTTDKPGTTDAWRLMVKEGARGRDAGDGPPKGHHVVRTK